MSADVRLPEQRQRDALAAQNVGPRAVRIDAFADEHRAADAALDDQPLEFRLGQRSTAAQSKLADASSR